MKRLLAAVCMITLAGCRLTSPVALEPSLTPSSATLPSDGPITAEPAGRIRFVQAIVAHDQVHLIARISHSPTPWSFQVFFDVDENQDTPDYGLGWEYVARGPGADPEGLVVRTTPFSPGNPGSGWGPVTGRFRARIHKDWLIATIPLAALGNDDGHMVIALDIYNGPRMDLFAYNYEIVPRGFKKPHHRPVPPEVIVSHRWRTAAD